MLNLCVTVRFGRILGVANMQIRQRIFRCFIMQVFRSFFTAFWNFWRITCLSTTNHRWVISAQTGPVFLAHSVVVKHQPVVYWYTCCAFKTQWWSRIQITFIMIYVLIGRFEVSRSTVTFWTYPQWLKRCRIWNIALLLHFLCLMH